jgi:hypothetical protein
MTPIGIQDIGSPLDKSISNPPTVWAISTATSIGASTGITASDTVVLLDLQNQSTL